MAVNPSPAVIPVDSQSCQAYNEAAFRYFLDIERRRAERAARPLLLVLVKLRSTSEATPDTRVVSALARCVREADFVGWLREGVTAAAVLALNAPMTAAAHERLRVRIRSALMRVLTQEEQARLTLRVLPVNPSSEI